MPVKLKTAIENQLKPQSIIIQLLGTFTSLIIINSIAKRNPQISKILQGF